MYFQFWKKTSIFRKFILLLCCCECVVCVCVCVSVRVYVCMQMACMWKSENFQK